MREWKLNWHLADICEKLHENLVLDQTTGHEKVFDLMTTLVHLFNDAGEGFGQSSPQPAPTGDKSTLTAVSVEQ